MGVDVVAETRVVGQRRVWARRRGEFHDDAGALAGLGPHRLGADRRARRADPDPGRVRRGVPASLRRPARSSGSRCRRRRPARRRGRSRSGPTSSTRRPTSTTRSTSTGSRRPSSRRPLRMRRGRDRRPAAPLPARVRGGRRRRHGPRGRRLARRGRHVVLPADGHRRSGRVPGSDRFRTMEERHDPDRRARWPDLRRHRRRPGRGRRRDRGRPDRRTSARASTATSAVDVAGRTLLPGLFDCHTHVCISDIDLLGEPSSSRSRYQFYEAQRNLPGDARGSGSRRSATPAAPTSGSSRRSRTG